MFDQTQRNKSRDVDTLWRHREKQTLDTPPAESRVGGLVWTRERNSRQFCILSLVKSESRKIMERSVSLLPSAGGCKFHFVSALLSCDLVFAVNLPARQETREISEIIRPPPAQPIMRTITFEQEQERRKVMMMVMMDSLRQLWYVSTHCWRTFQLVWGETFDELYCQDTIFSSHEAIQFKYLPKSVCQGLWEISKEKSLKPKISRRLRPPTWFWVRLGGEGGR